MRTRAEPPIAGSGAWVLGVGVLVGWLAMMPVHARGEVDARPRLAVLELTRGPRVDRQLVAALSDRVREGISKEAGRRFSIVTRENVSAMSPEGAQPHPESDDAPSEVDAGRDLRADVVVTGTVRLIDAHYALELRAFDTHQGALLATRHVDASRKPELLEGARRAAMQLLREAVPELPAAKRTAAWDASGQVSMVAVPGGTYWMGSRGRRAFLIPGDRVTVSPFLLDHTEVPAAKYAVCVREGGCQPPGAGPACTFGVSGKGDHPVNCVTWAQADAYCRWARKRLPTEEEWEWAARATRWLGRFPWGRATPGTQLCWSGPGSDRAARGFAATCPVGSHPAGDSPQGAKDLAGSVAEWTSTPSGTGYVVRGGSWASVSAEVVTASWRTKGSAEASSEVGFRCAKGLGP